MRIRLAKLSDSKQLVDILASSFAEEISLSNLNRDSIKAQVSLGTIASYPWLRHLLRAMGVTLELWVAEEGGQVLGCVMLHSTKRRLPLNISSLAVHPEHRHKGIGRSLMSVMFQRTKQLGRNIITLEVMTDNTPAVNLYQSLGMEEYDRRLSYRYIVNPMTIGTDLSGVSLSPVNRADIPLWREIINTSPNVPIKLEQIMRVYEEEYISRARRNLWLPSILGRLSTYQQYAIYNQGKTVGFVAARNMLRGNPTESLPPLCLPQAGLNMTSVFIRLQEMLLQYGSRAHRLYVSAFDGNQIEAAQMLGYRFEKSWSYMYKML